ncbi:MAG: response regulator transcription factor [Oryzomonas sp.]|uniref:response regulator transcription factor n=1 Tax=Oryzomonas sp. TaxID=2855186 RepID=UPI0028475A00|nr:response regulator transcription factor [Oryzomonas sp.]MDR3579235.1 response regulator transcription factor [Oryzomonas sp.]
MNLKILIADDHAIFREGLRALLEKESDIEVVAEACDGNEALQKAREHQPDVIVMDITMPGMNGIDSTRKITSETDKIRVLALSMESDRRFVVEVLEAGATGYLLKDTAYAEFVMAIRTVASGEPYLPPQITHLLLKEFLQRVPDVERSPYDKLTAREREVLKLLADGMNAKEIAFKLDVSQKTIENQRISIMNKLNLYSIAELTKFAIREGITTYK